MLAETCPDFTESITCSDFTAAIIDDLIIGESPEDLTRELVDAGWDSEITAEYINCCARRVAGTKVPSQALTTNQKRRFYLSNAKQLLPRADLGVESLSMRHNDHHGLA